MKPPTPNMTALLNFIRERHAQTGQPVTQAEVSTGAPIPANVRTSATCGLLDRGLISVPRIGTPAWLPTKEST